MEIPKQLSKCRFIRANTKKQPIEKAWPTTANYSYDEFKPDIMYGVLCGHNGLVVIDVDKKYIQDKLIIIEEFRRTFTTKTASKKLYHFYFYTDHKEPKSMRFDNIRNERILDFQGMGTQVIGPGSKMDDIGEYEVVNPAEIQQISYEYLKTIIENIEDNIKVAVGTTKKKKAFVFPEFDEVCKSIKEKITIHDILPRLGIKPNPDKSNCKCPLGHPSEGGKCFSYTDVLFDCFHCGETGNIFQLYMKVKKVKFMEARLALAKIAGVEQSFKQQIKDLMTEPKTRPMGIERMAQEFMKVYTIYTIRHDTSPEMLIYKDGIFVQNGESYIHEFARGLIENLYQETYANKVVEKVMVDTYINEERFYAAAPINLIPFKNTVLNLETMETVEYTPEMRFMNKHPVVYDPTIESELMVKFIKDITNGPNDMKTLQELCGYIFWRENKFEKSIMLLGNGRNGKSKFIDILKLLLGHENVVNITLADLEKNDFSMANLHNKHANFSPDLSKEALENTGKFKSLIGRDTITANRKNKSHIHFKNYAKFVFATNNLPYTEDQSDGFFDRWIMLDFPFKFVEKPSEPHHKIKDPNIIEKITTEKELSGFLNWSLVGLKRLLERGEFTITDTTEQIKMKWLRESSSLTGFVSEFVERTRSRKDFIGISDFDFAYSEYCIENDVDQDNRKVKSSRMKQLGISKGRKFGGNSGYFGIKLKGKYEIINIDIEEVQRDEDV